MMLLCSRRNHAERRVEHENDFLRQSCGVIIERLNVLPECLYAPRAAPLPLLSELLAQEPAHPVHRLKTVLDIGNRRFLAADPAQNII